MTEQEAIALVSTLLESKKGGGRLSDIQQRVFLGTWAESSYQQIADKFGYQSDYVKQVGYQLWRDLSTALGEPVNKGNIHSILHHFHQLPPPVRDWGEAIDVSRFYGREVELETLENWINESKCRLVGIFGIGGIGKTALSVKLSQQVQSQFPYLIWRTLRQAPSLTELLKDIVPILVGSEAAGEADLKTLMAQLHQKRCLLVLDNIESILKSGSRSGAYKPGYEDYQQLLERIADETHSSCLLVTGREKPGGYAIREGANLPVRAFSLTGISTIASQQILKDKGLTATESQNRTLVNYFGGNPLALKIATTTIQTLFGGNIQAFLAQGSAVFSNLWDLLDQQFSRLSPLQQQVMYWLAINREGVTPGKLQAEILPQVTIKQVMEALEALQERSLIESQETGITQQPVVMEYVTEQLIDKIEQEIISYRFDIFTTHALIEAQAPDYLREAQIQLILQPLCDRLRSAQRNRLSVYFPTKSQLEAYMCQILAFIRSNQITGYAGGNLLNLFTHLKTDLTGFDFSHLAIRQAYLTNTTLHQTNFTGAKFEQSVFAETFGGVLCVRYSPDGKLLATSDSNGGIQVWDSRTFEPILRFRGHGHWAWAIAVSPDNRYLASTAADDLVKLWDIQTGECLQIYTKHTYVVNAIAFHPDGEIFASAGEDLAIRFWSTQNLEDREIKILLGHTERIWSLAFNPDGKTLASCGEDLTVRFWDLETGVCVRVWQAHSGWIWSLAFNPDGNILATSSFDKTIKLWDVRTQECLKTLSGHQGAVTGIAFNQINPSLLASASYDRTAKLWNLETGTCEKTFLGHTSRLWSIAYHPQTGEISTGGDDHATKIWHLATGRCTKTLKGHSNAVMSLAISPDGEFFASGHEDQAIRLWSVSNGELIQTLREHTNRIWSVAFSPTQSLLASGSADYSVKLWDCQSEESYRTLLGHKSWVWSVSFSPDGQKLASGSYDQTVKIWDVTTGQCQKTLMGQTSQLTCVTFSPDGNYIATSDFAGAIAIEDLNNRDPTLFLKGHTSIVWSVIFTTDGECLLSTSGDGTIKLWSVTTGECLRTFTGHQGAVHIAKFIPNTDPPLIISGSGDSTLKVWEVETGKCQQTLVGHSNTVYTLLALSKSQTISGSFDETIKFWDLETGICQQTLRVPNPYEGMKISQVKGLSETQLATLTALGAIVDT
jgi:WD40 repeat protein